MKILRRLLSRMHVHVWFGTILNPWCIEIEQRCRCGAYRHHFLDDYKHGILEEPSWREGRHPGPAKP